MTMKSQTPLQSPSVRRGQNNGSAQMSAAFSALTPQEISLQNSNVSGQYSVRRQAHAAERRRTSMEVAPLGSATEVDARFQQSKTVSRPHALSVFKKAPGSVPPERSASHVFDEAPKVSLPEHPRNTKNHTDPFAEDRDRDFGKKKKLLMPASCLKAGKFGGIKCGGETRQKSASPFNQDDDTANFSVQALTSPFANGNGRAGSQGSQYWSPCPSPVSQASLTSPMRLSKRCTFEGNGKPDSRRVFNSEVAGPASGAEMSVSRASTHGESGRFKFSAQGKSSMDRPLSAEESASAARTHKKTTEQSRAKTMVGVFSAMPERRTAHTGKVYKFTAPFARQTSIASLAKIQHGKRTTKVSADNATKTPFARHESSRPGETSISRTRRTFHAEKHTLRTPFARQTSVAPTAAPHASRKYFHQPKNGSPFAVDY